MTTHNLTADGSTPTQTRSPSEWRVIVLTTGDFGGGTLDVEYSANGSTWVADGSLSFSDDGVGIFNVHQDLKYRATLSNSTAPDVDVTFFPGASV